MSLDPVVPAPKNSMKWLWVVGLVGALVVFGVIATGGSGNTTPAAAPPSTSTVAPKPGLEVPPSAPAVAPTPVHIVVFEVTGAGTGTATFSTDGVGGTSAATDVPLPWTTTVELPVDPGQAISLVAEAGPGTLEISAKITVDGQVVREGKSGGTYLSVSLNATVGA